MTISSPWPMNLRPKPCMTRLMPSVVLLAESTSSKDRLAPGVPVTSTAGPPLIDTSEVPAAGTVTFPALESRNAAVAPVSPVSDRSLPEPSPSETVPVVLTSGYSHVLSEHGSYGFELLQKPYSIEQLSRVLHRVGRRKFKQAPAAASS